MPNFFLFITLTFLTFMFLLFLFPRILYYVVLVSYLFKQKNKKKNKNKLYSLKSLKEINSEKIKI
tara:strand:- start:284 stop:478 length:195 start_codon:yes stop_codon:yes gene_type:complete